MTSPDRHQTEVGFKDGGGNYDGFYGSNDLDGWKWWWKTQSEPSGSGIAGRGGERDGGVCGDSHGHNLLRGR
jgi:hypothetical protein